MAGRSREPDASMDTGTYPSTCSIPSEESYCPVSLWMLECLLSLLVLGCIGSLAHKARVEVRGTSAAFQHPLLIPM